MAEELCGNFASLFWTSESVQIPGSTSAILQI